MTALPNGVLLRTQLIICTDVPPEAPIHPHYIFYLPYNRRAYIQCEVRTAIMVVVSASVPVIHLLPFRWFLVIRRQRYR